MALTDGLKNITGSSVNLPIIGAISIPVLVIGGFLLFKLFTRKRVSSVTTRYSRR